MTIFDYVILAILAIAAISGASKGLVKQIAALVGLVVGLLAARALYISVAAKLSPLLTNSMNFAQIIAFVAIWVIVPMAFLVLASMFTHALEAASLGFINRLLGAVFGAALWVLILGFLAIVLDTLDTNNIILSQTIKDDSMLYYPIKDWVYFFISSLLPANEVLNGGNRTSPVNKDAFSLPILYMSYATRRTQ